MTEVRNTAHGKVVFAMVGAGWRSEFFLRIARELPSRFEVCGVVVRDPAKGAAFEERWSIPTFRSIAELLARTSPQFVVVSVPRQVVADVITEITASGLAVLTETPPGDDVPSMAALHELVVRGAKIQVAEQYHLEPLLSAQLSLAQSGRIGTVDQAQVGLAHDFHGISIIRKALGVGFADAVITAWQFTRPIVMGPSRAGDPEEEKLVPAVQTTARMDFGDQLGIYDFAPQQYRSWIRSNRLLIRGDRGEIHNTEVRYLKDFRTPMHLTITRMSTGENTNLEGQFLRGLIAGDEWVYRNEFIPGRLMDDEIAIATCLVRMAEHSQGGPDFYSLADASQDYYLHSMMLRSIESGESVRTERQAWAREEAP
ncbi:MAG: oxidoreductase [Rhodoglobus sp.]|nr:oxidoreductase [Rhodoglobus sp.]